MKPSFSNPVHTLFSPFIQQCIPYPIKSKILNFDQDLRFDRTSSCYLEPSNNYLTDVWIRFTIPDISKDDRLSAILNNRVETFKQYASLEHTIVRKLLLGFDNDDDVEDVFKNLLKSYRTTLSSAYESMFPIDGMNKIAYNDCLFYRLGKLLSHRDKIEQYARHELIDRQKRQHDMIVHDTRNDMNYWTDQIAFAMLERVVLCVGSNVIETYNSDMLSWKQQFQNIYFTDPDNPLKVAINIPFWFQDFDNRSYPLFNGCNFSVKIRSISACMIGDVNNDMEILNADMVCHIFDVGEILPDLWSSSINLTINNQANGIDDDSNRISVIDSYSISNLDDHSYTCKFKIPVHTIFWTISSVKDVWLPITMEQDNMKKPTMQGRMYINHHKFPSDDDVSNNRWSLGGNDVSLIDLNNYVVFARHPFSSIPNSMFSSYYMPHAEIRFSNAEREGKEGKGEKEEKGEKGGPYIINIYAIGYSNLRYLQ